MYMYSCIYTMDVNFIFSIMTSFCSLIFNLNWMLINTNWMKDTNCVAHVMTLLNIT